MSTSAYPPLPPAELKAAEEESLARELSWLLSSLQETLTSLKSGLEECYALLAPIEPGSTLVMSSPRSESIKGHITRVGGRIVKGQLQLRLRSLPVQVFSISADEPLVLPSLTHLRTLLNQSLDCIDITRWTGDRQSAPFISGQLRLLHSILLEALPLLKGPNLLTPAATHGDNPKRSPTVPTPPEISEQPQESDTWFQDPPEPESFVPTLPDTLSLHLTLMSPSVNLTVRVLEPTSVQLNLGSRLAFALGAQRRLEHDEMDELFTYKGEEVHVREKVQVESSADPSLLSLGAKLGQLERVVEAQRGALRCVMGVGDYEDE